MSRDYLRSNEAKLYVRLFVKIKIILVAFRFDDQDYQKLKE